MALSAKQFKEALDGLAKGDPSKIDFDGFFMELRKKGASPRELLRIEGRLSSLPGFSKEASRFRGVAARVATMPIPAPAPKPKGPKPKTPKPGKAGILSRLSGLAKGAKGLVRTPTFGGVAALDEPVELELPRAPDLLADALPLAVAVAVHHAH